MVVSGGIRHPFVTEQGYTSCLYNNELTTDPVSINENIALQQLIIDGVPYVPSPIEVSFEDNFISIGPYTYNTGWVDRLNQMFEYFGGDELVSLPEGVSFEYPTEADLALLDGIGTVDYNNSFRLILPTGSEFTLTQFVQLNGEGIANAPFIHRVSNLVSQTSIDQGVSYQGTETHDYLFNTLGCEVYEAQLESCIYCDDTNSSDVGPNTRYILSLVVENVEYVPTPMGIDTQYILIGSVLWNTGLVDAINSLDIPNFFAEYPSEADMNLIDALDEDGVGEPKPKNTIRITNEVGKTFELVVSANNVLSDGDFMITESQFFIRQSGAWLEIEDGDFYPFTRKGCVTE